MTAHRRNWTDVLLLPLWTISRELEQGSEVRRTWAGIPALRPSGNHVTSLSFSFPVYTMELLTASAQ